MSENKFVISEKVEKPITKDMIGLFFEDINLAADGGLYAEMLENRSFEAINSMGAPRNYVLQEDNIYGWNSISGKEKNLQISSNDPVSEKNPHYLRFTAEKSGEGFSNKAYDGISLVKGMKYNVSFYAREVNYLKGDIKVQISKDGKIFGDSTVKFIVAQENEPDGYEGMVGNCESKIWRKYETQITALDNIQKAKFEILLTETGVVEFDLISMIPEDAVEGIFRKDLFNALANLHPSFVRFPGGCIVEGTSLMRRYYWKNTVGELKDRKIQTNLWALQGGNTLYANQMQDSHYMQSYGIGFYEYFLLCEKLSTAERKCQPLPVLNIGVACQFRSYQTVPVNSPEFMEYVQDALDLIEFANGPVDSKWGSLRAQMGHPESFNLELLAIGNEQWESRQVDVAPRYIAFEKAIHKVYPEIKCLGTAGPFVNHELHTKAWDFYRENCAKNPDFAYAVDEHYYVAPQWLYENVDFYDNYPRNIGIFAGEYAGHDCNLTNSVESGIAEAAMLTGMERNGDIVKLASYAPLFNRIGHSQWTPDMIWFDADKVVLTPSYYVQKIFSDYSGSEVLVLNGQEKDLRNQKLYVSAVKDGSKKIIKIVNGDEKAQKINLVNEDGAELKVEAETLILQAKDGKYKAPAENGSVDPNGPNKSISAEKMSNLELCNIRFPEECECVNKTALINGQIEIPGKSLLVLKF
ncbi:MAG: hypothetical protein MJ174_09415 [Treponema sp.]|nr:hypothetical protein [Treponema sp.]